jgi:3-hydroxybutyryl-CoA dehydrogenase
MKVGIVGSGVMGTGISQVFAQNEKNEVILNDVSNEIAQRGLERHFAKIDKLVNKGKMDAAVAKGIKSRTHIGEKKDFADVDLVIEATIERMDVKKDVFLTLHRICKPETLFTTNTSSLSITEIGNGIGRPVCGMHFFNPAEIMQLVEVVAGMHTPPDMIEKVKAIARDVGKTPIQEVEGPGFVVNRILILMINEAVGVFADGIAGAEDIDTALRLGANHRMGPLALCDLIGLDICLAIMETFYVETGDSKYRPHPLLRKMVRGGFLGQKTGEGFFKYPVR